MILDDFKVKDLDYNFEEKEVYFDLFKNDDYVVCLAKCNIETAKLMFHEYHIGVESEVEREFQFLVMINKSIDICESSIDVKDLELSEEQEIQVNTYLYKQMRMKQ